MFIVILEIGVFRILFFNYVMSQFEMYVFRLHNCIMGLFGFISLSYNVVTMQIWFKNWSRFEKNTLEDCIIWQSIFNGLISCLHLRSKYCRVWLFNFEHTSKNVVLQVDIKI